MNNTEGLDFGSTLKDGVRDIHLVEEDTHHQTSNSGTHDHYGWARSWRKCHSLLLLCWCGRKGNGEMG